MTHCTKCGQEITNGNVCPVCGENVEKALAEASAKNWAATYILNIFLGLFGAHRFYTGYIGIGIAQLLTLGGFGIWTFVDNIALSFNMYEDINGNKPEGYNNIAGIVGFIFGGLFKFLNTIFLELYILFILFFLIIGVAASASGS